jgi:type VI secretion system protein ImpJ
MPQARRILWGEGMFLRPQHFQQQVMFLEQGLSNRLNLTQRNDWGVARCQLDEDGLKAGVIRFNDLSLLFRDGTLYQAPLSSNLPPSREISSLPQLGIETTLYACLAELQPYGGNTRAAETGVRPTRFFSSQQAIQDLYTQSLEASLSTLELDVRLMIEEENRDGYDAIPLAKIARDATGQWQVNQTFLPPLVNIAGSTMLRPMLRRLLEILLVKSASLGGAHRERSQSVKDFGPSDVGTFWLHHTVNHNFARLSHLAKSHPVTPEELYRAMSEFCGELLTFSSIYSLSDIPEYRHDALGEVFTQLDLQIRDLLDTVISARYAVIPLNSTKQSFFIGHLESDRLLEDVEFYLSVHSDLPASQVIDNVPLKFKIGAPDDVEKILNSAMRGVALVHALQTPSAIPVRMGNHYFALDPQSTIYQRMLQSRSVCIYVPETLSELSLELIAVFH